MKLGVMTITTLVLTLPLLGCVSSTVPVPEEATHSLSATSIPETIPTASPAVTAPSMAEILATPLSTVPFDDRVLATFDINFADEVVYAVGYVWAKTDNGHVFQVDPSTNSVVGDVRVDTTSDPYHYCQGLATDGESIWACSAAGDADNRTIDVVQIDPHSLEVVATVEAGKLYDQLDMPFLLDQIWVLTDRGFTLVGIDVTSKQPRTSIDLGVRCFQLAASNNSLLATCFLDNLVLRIDPAEEEITSRVTLESPRGIAASENGVWIAQDNGIARLDPRSLDPVATFRGLYGVGLTGDIFASDEVVWIREERGFLYRINPASNELVEQIAVDQALSSGSVVATSDSVWTTAYDDNILMRLSLK